MEMRDLTYQNKKNPLRIFTESKNERIINLELQVKDLNEICQELNPYAQIPDRIKEKLKKFHIIDLYDPFSVTNKLLVLLEDSIEELMSLKQKK